MFHGRSANELGLASAAVVLSLIQRLEKKGTLKREDALALLGDAADRLVATPRDTTVSTSGAVDVIRQEFLTKVSRSKLREPSRFCPMPGRRPDQRKRMWIAMISTMRTARPTTGSPLSLFEAGTAPFDPASSCFCLFDLRRKSLLPNR